MTPTTQEVLPHPHNHPKREGLMKHLTAALAALLVAVGALVVPVGDGIIIDATGPNVASAAAPAVNEDPGGGGSSTWQPCDAARHHLGVVMSDTVQGVYGYTQYNCNAWAAGGWYVWDYNHGAWFRNTSGVGWPWYTMNSQYTSAWIPYWQWP